MKHLSRYTLNALTVLSLLPCVASFILIHHVYTPKKFGPTDRLVIGVRRHVLVEVPCEGDTPEGLTWAAAIGFAVLPLAGPGAGGWWTAAHPGR